MSEELKLQESIKKTQDLLGKYIKKPSLTDKLLKKPPFRFLHDIISAVIKETGFLKGLFTDDELNSANITDKDSKLSYLNKLIDSVKLISGNDLNVRASKIISGQEPIKTNELLQVIGKCLDKKVSSSEAIEFYKKSLVKKEKRSKVSTPADEKLKKPAKKSSSSEKLRDKNPEKVKRDSKPSSRDSRHSDGSDKRSVKDNRKETETRRRRSDRTPDKTIIKESKKSLSKAESVDNNPEPPTPPVEPPESVESNAPPSATKKETESLEKVEKVEVKVSEEPEKIVKDEKVDLPIELESKQPEIVAEKPKEKLLRPPSVRPPSARPGAPRVRGKSDFVVNSANLTQTKDVSIIVENFDAKDDDVENMVVVESSAVDDNLLTNVPDPLNDQLTQEHGYLVAQILETQKELVNEGNVEIIPNKVEIEWSEGIKKDRDIVVKEIDKLRGTIQTLTRATNPLGKLFDFLQEDVEVMQKELQDWRQMFQKIKDQLIVERKSTDLVMKPLEDSLKDIQNSIDNQMEKIFQTKANIFKNNQKIHKLLSAR